MSDFPTDSQSANEDQVSKSDRRVWVRHHSTPATPLFSVAEPEAIHTWGAKVRDISQGGVSILLNGYFAPDTVLDIELPLTEGSGSRVLPAKVVRVQPHKKHPLWLVACVFLQPLSPEELRQFV